VKIINPEKKTEFIVREVHSYHDKFESIGVMKVKLMEEFSENVPKTLDFNVGYLAGKQNTKYWLMCQVDLNGMYKSLKTNNTYCCGAMLTSLKQKLKNKLKN